MTTALDDNSWSVKGNVRFMEWLRGLGWMKGFPNRSRFSRLSFRKSPGSMASRLCAADRYLSFESQPMWKGKQASSLLSSLRLTSSRSRQKWVGSACRRLWLRSRSCRLCCREERQRASLKASRWLLCSTRSERQLRSPMVAGSFLMWLLLRSSLRRAKKTKMLRIHVVIYLKVFQPTFEG